MRIGGIGAISVVLFVLSSAVAQETSLTRAEVAAIKAKLVTVQEAMGADPSGYLKESEEFSLPTDANPAQDGKFWPIQSSVSLRYGDRAVTESRESAEQANKDLEQRYSAAIASGDPNAILKLTEEITRMTQQAAAASAVEPKQPMHVYVQFNMSPYAAIDPDAVVFESPGVIALRDADDLSGERGSVTVYLDPVALKATETLSKIELKTTDGGVGNKSGVFNIQISANGTIADIEEWVKSFDTAAMLSVIDSQ
jgi:hypothetical protein